MKTRHALLLFAIIAAFAATTAFAQTFQVQLNVFISAPTVGIPSFAGFPVPAGSYNAGDNRGFNQSGTSRISQGILIQSATWTVLQIQGPTIGQSVLFDSNGNQIAAGYADAGSIQTSVTVNQNQIIVTFSGDPTNPTVPFAPGINYSVTVVIQRNPGGDPSAYVQSYNHDAFPSYEMLTSTNGAPKRTIWLAAETTPSSLLVNPYRTLAGGYPPESWHIPLIPSVQNEDWRSQTDFINQYVIGGSSADPATAEAIVTVGPLKVLQYQDPTTGTWNNWEN